MGYKPDQSVGPSTTQHKNTGGWPGITLQPVEEAPFESTMTRTRNDRVSQRTDYDAPQKSSYNDSRVNPGIIVGQSPANYKQRDDAKFHFNAHD